jgi:hypothetical protein
VKYVFLGFCQQLYFQAEVKNGKNDRDDESRMLQEKPAKGARKKCRNRPNKYVALLPKLTAERKRKTTAVINFCSSISLSPNSFTKLPKT